MAKLSQEVELPLVPLATGFAIIELAASELGKMKIGVIRRRPSEVFISICLSKGPCDKVVIIERKM